MMKQIFKQREGHPADERGQSIVLIAFALLGLLVLVGLAVDVGFVFARRTQLQTAVDAAALAGVTELRAFGNQIERQREADQKARQFLATNEMPASVVETMETEADTTIIGAREYTVRASWDVELFFMRLIGRDQITVSREATAAFFPLTDIYASRRVEDGIVNTSNQGIFGPAVCPAWGDPFSPLRSPFETPKPRNADGTYSYTYRIRVPESYRDENNLLQVEIFDPDSINQAGDTFTIQYSDTFSQTIAGLGLPPRGTTKECGTNTSNAIARHRWNPCLLETGELSPTIGLDDIDAVNPYWIIRIDENRGTGSHATFHGDFSCTDRSNRDYLPYYNTRTRFELYYFRENRDGTIEKISLAKYTGQVGDDIRDNGDHNTDLRWVVPGVTAGVPVDPDSPLSSFLLRIEEGANGEIGGDVPSILKDAGNGDIYIYMDVTGLSGASENGFELWAGPPPTVAIPDNVNERNLVLLEDPLKHNSDGATVFAVGNLPMNSNFGLLDRDVRNEDEGSGIVEVDIPLIYVGPEFAGAEIDIRLFDPDAGATPPITFFFDSVAEEDWSLTFGETSEGRCFERDKIWGGDPYSCGTRWLDPPYTIVVPGVLENCDWNNAADDRNCVPFYGGRLIARYRGGFSDTFGWEISLEGLPFLTE